MRKWRDQQFLRIEVGPLPDRDLRTLAEGAIGGPVDGASLQAIVESSGGNVLFLRELIHGALESRVLTSELGLWHLRGSLAHSPRLRDLIEERLTGLSTTERETLELVALGDPVPLKLLEHLVPLEAIEQLEGRGLLDVRQGRTGPELRLNHPLYGDVVRAQLPSLRRIRLSRSLADAADIDGVAGPAATPCGWRSGGSTVGAAAASRSPRPRPGPPCAWRTTPWPSGSAVRPGSSPPPSTPPSCWARPWTFSGSTARPTKSWPAATPMVSNDWQRTKLTVRRAAILFRSLGDADAGSDVVIDEAMALVSDPACRRELQALRGNHLLMAGEVARSIAQGEELLLVPGDAAFAQASLDVGVGLAFAGRTREAIDHVDAAFSARIDLEDEEQLSAVGIYLVAQSLAHMHAGNLATAAGIGDAGYQVSVEKNNADGQAWFACILGLIYLNQGRPASAANMFRESATFFGALNHPGRPRRPGLGGIALAAAFLGDSST